MFQHGLQGYWKLFASARLQPVAWPGAAAPLADFGPYLQGEVLLTQALPYAAAAVAAAVCACLGAGAAALAGGAMVAVFMLRAALLDWKLSMEPRWQHVPLVEHVILVGGGEEKEGEAVGHPKRLAWAGFLLSKLELADAVSDGVALATVFFQERSSVAFRERLLMAWAHGGGPAPLLTPAVGLLGLGGLMLALLLCATLAQLSAAMGEGGDAVRAELAGLGGAAEQLASASENTKEGAKVFTTLARSIAEGLPQMLLQTSALSAQGASLRSQPALVASLALSLFGATKKALELLEVACKRFSKAKVVCLFIASCSFSMLGACGYFAVKVVMVDRCPQHGWALAWPLDAGCLDFGSP